MPSEQPHTLQPRFAGAFGPADADAQRAALGRWIHPASGTPRAVGLVLPHGAWVDAGPVIGAALSACRLEELVVLLAPNHACRGPRATIVSHGTFALPTGAVPIDEALAESVRALGGLTELPEVLDAEHAVEVLLPFLLQAQPRLSVVPIVLHDVAPAAARRIGHALADAIVARGGVTLVATSNLAHYVPAEAVPAATDALIEAIAAGDAEAFVAALIARGQQTGGGSIVETCGLSTLLVYLEALAHLGQLGRGRCVARGHSVDPGYPEAAVVAYASLVHTRA